MDDWVVWEQWDLETTNLVTLVLWFVNYRINGESIHYICFWITRSWSFVGNDLQSTMHLFPWSSYEVQLCSTWWNKWLCDDHESEMSTCSPVLLNCLNQFSLFLQKHWSSNQNRIHFLMEWIVNVSGSQCGLHDEITDLYSHKLHACKCIHSSCISMLFVKWQKIIFIVVVLWHSLLITCITMETFWQSSK